MKRYAVPIAGDKLAEHFGHCEHFALFDADDDTCEIVGRRLVPSPGHQPGMLPGWLAQQGVSMVIAKGMGSRAQALFNENRIGVVFGAAIDDPEQAVLDHLRGVLVEEGNPCDH